MYCLSDEQAEYQVCERLSFMRFLGLGLLIPAFGDKSHINIDRRFRLIRRFTVTDATRHDGARRSGLLNPDAFDSRV